MLKSDFKSITFTIFVKKEKMNEQKINTNRFQTLAFIPIAIALNVGIGAIVKVLGLPLYLDSMGTIIATILLGWRVGALVGVLGFVITALTVNPFAIYFVFTQFMIAITVDFMARRKFYSTVPKVIVTGIILGIVAAIASAPVIVAVFQGATGNGAALVTSFFAKMGNQIMQSVMLSGISIEPIDKTLQTLLVFFLLKSMPKSLLKGFSGGTLERNNLV